MTKTYRYIDDKSDKFWRIEISSNEFLLNYGKTGTNGTYQIKSFDNEELCIKEANKLITSKTKKGYSDFFDFDIDNHCFFDDEEVGLHRLTSHPNFRNHFTDEQYYDCVDEEAPFGSDEGADTLGQITEDFRKSKNFDFVGFPKKLIEKYWDMVYYPPTDLSKASIETLLQTDEVNLIQSDMVTYATAFAQIKITGKIDLELKNLALKAMKRLGTSAVILGWTANLEDSKMIKDLEQFSIYS